MMSEAAIALTVMTFLILVIFLAFLVWGIRTGQFKNVEEAKYIPLQDDGFDGDDRHLAQGGDAHGDPGREEGGTR